MYDTNNDALVVRKSDCKSCIKIDIGNDVRLATGRTIPTGSFAQLYDVDICEYVDKAWIEPDVKNLVDYDHIGYTLVTLSVALWAFWHATSFVDGLLAVVNA